MLLLSVVKKVINLLFNSSNEYRLNTVIIDYHKYHPLTKLIDILATRCVLLYLTKYN